MSECICDIEGRTIRDDCPKHGAAPASLAGGRELTPDEYKAREVVVQESADGWFRLHPSLRTEEAYKDYLRFALSLWAKMSGSPAPPLRAPRAESDSQSESDYEPGAGPVDWEELRREVVRDLERVLYGRLNGVQRRFLADAIMVSVRAALAATREVAGPTREGGSREPQGCPDCARGNCHRTHLVPSPQPAGAGTGDALSEPGQKL